MPFKWIITERRKNAAAYQVSLSAVKNIQREKSGIDTTRDVIPENTASFGLLFMINKAKITKKTISCIFITITLYLRSPISYNQA